MKIRHSKQISTTINKYIDAVGEYEDDGSYLVRQDLYNIADCSSYYNNLHAIESGINLAEKAIKHKKPIFRHEFRYQDPIFYFIGDEKNVIARIKRALDKRVKWCEKAYGKYKEEV